MKWIAASEPTGSAVSPLHPLHRTRFEPALLLSLLVLLYAACLGADSRLSTPLKLAASALQPNPPLPPQPVSIPLSNVQNQQYVSGYARKRRQRLFAGRHPSFVVLSNEHEELNPLSLLSPEEKVGDTKEAAEGKGTEQVHAFSFWHWPRFSPPSTAQTSTASQTPGGSLAASEQEVHTPDVPVVLHFPAVTEGWAQQSDDDAAERAAIAGAAVTCGDLLLVQLPLEALSSPAALLSQTQPLPLLLAALQLQLQLRIMRRQETQGTPALPAALAAAANRTKPMVILLPDPPVLFPEASRSAKGKDRGDLMSAAEARRLSVSHAALRLLEEQWRAMASELGLVLERGPPQPQQQQQPPDSLQQQQQQGNPLVPSLRELFSVHVVFVPKQPNAAPSGQHAAQTHPPPGFPAALQRLLRSLVMQHRRREAQGTSHTAPVEQQHGQRQHQMAVGADLGKGDSALGLYDAAATACRMLVAATGLTSQPCGKNTAGATSPPKKIRELTSVDAAAFDAELYRRRCLSRFRAGLAEAAGLAEGYGLLQRVLREFDECCAASGKATTHRAVNPAKVASATAEARQALEDESVNELLLLYRVQLEALRSVTTARFDLFLKQLLSSPANRESREEGLSQQENIHELANRITEAIRQTADNFYRLIFEYHRALEPEALRKMLLASDGQGQAHADRATAREVVATTEALAAKERRLLLGTLREIAASVLQEQHVLLVQQQRQNGFGFLQRLQQNARSRFLATRQGAAALRGWRHLRNAAGSVRSYLEQLPLVHQLLDSPIAALCRKRKPVDISLHYLSPTAFGFADIKNTATLHQPWEGKLHVQQLTSRTSGNQLLEETLVPPVASASELRHLRESLTMVPPDAH